MSEREYVIGLLKDGAAFRLIDGRYDHNREGGYVDPEVLQKLVSEGRAEIYKLQGMDFVRTASTATSAPASTGTQEPA